jgi:hypothetical protein
MSSRRKNTASKKQTRTTKKGGAATHLEAARVYRNVRRTEEELIALTDLVVEQVFEGEDLFALSWDLFERGLEVPLGDRSMYAQSFLPWFWFDMPLFGETSDALETFAEGLLKTPALCPTPLTRQQRLFLTTGLRTNLSWYVVERVEEGMELELRDLFSNDRVVVREHTASRLGMKGVTILTRVMTLDGVSFLCGTWPIPLGPSHRHILLRARESLEDVVKSAAGSDVEHALRAMGIRTLFINLAQGVRDLAEKGPQIQNMDGEPFECLELRWSLSLPLEEAARILNQLDREGDGLLDTTVGSNGALTSVSIAYMRPPKSEAANLDVVAVGRIVAEPGVLKVEVNSRQRSEEMAALMVELFGGHIDHQSLAPGKTEHPLASSGLSDLPNLDDHPGAREALDEFMRKQMERWLVTPIPMLENLSPREAAKTERGRELLDALLASYSDTRSATLPNMRTLDVDHLRAALGLVDTA